MSKPPDYGGCETGCSHDLARGILKADLQLEGPFPDTHPLLTTGWLADQIAAAVNRQAEQRRGSAVSCRDYEYFV